MSKLKISILLVDDDVYFSKTLEQDLKERFKSGEGHGDINISLVFSSETAKDLLNKVHYDLVLLDYYLEGSNTAEELIPIIKKKGSYVIVISAEAGGEEAAKTIILGADDYWEKGSGFDSLMKKIEVFIRRKQKDILSEKWREKYKTFFSRFLTNSLNLVKSAIHVLEMLKNYDKLALLVSGEIGVGKSYFIDSLILHLKSNIDELRIVKLFGTATDADNEVRETVEKVKNVLNYKNVVFYVNGITVLSQNNQRQLMRLVDDVIENVNVTRKFYFFAESAGDTTQITREALLPNLMYRFTRTLTIPPLRERIRDIVLLAEYFLNVHAPRKNIRLELSPRAKYLLLNCLWEGNVFQLKNLMRQVAMFHDEETNIIEAEDILKHMDEYGYKPLDINQIEKEQILKALLASNCNKKIAAKLLGISRPTLYSKMKKYGIEC